MGEGEHGFMHVFMGHLFATSVWRQLLNWSPAMRTARGRAIWGPLASLSQRCHAALSCGSGDTSAILLQEDI